MSAFQRWFVWSTSALTGLTGLVYWWMEHGLEPVDPWAAVNHPLQGWVLKAHILVAPLMVFAIGLVAADHIWRHYRTNAGAGRRSGLTAWLVFAPMVLSGYLIQAVTHVGLLEILAWGHLLTGSAYLVGIGLHTRFARASAGRVKDGARALVGTADSSGRREFSVLRRFTATRYDSHSTRRLMRARQD